MRILYIAKHDSGGNDDEGAIYDALLRLGHTVTRLREVRGRAGRRVSADVTLFHKWDDFQSMKEFKTPLVFWYFDLVDFPDASIADRCRARVRWMEFAVPRVQLGFCTDGDWVRKDKSGKLIWLPQGADQRYAGSDPTTEEHDILFTGIRRGGRGRTLFVDYMTKMYGPQFHHIERGVYLRELKREIARHKVVMAPCGPVTDHYWSNRVYMAGGYGACLVHPYCQDIVGHFQEGAEILYYRNLEQMKECVDSLLRRPEQRRFLRESILQRVQKEHLYLHRCEQLVNIVRERLGIP